MKHILIYFKNKIIDYIIYMNISQYIAQIEENYKNQLAKQNKEIEYLNKQLNELKTEYSTRNIST